MVLFGRSGESAQTRLGITVTRKVGNAVRRNRIKRVMREAFRRNRESLQPPLDLVVNIRPSLGEVTYDGLEAELLNNFRRLARRIAP